MRFRYPSVGLIPGQTIRLSAASLRTGNPPPEPDRVRFIVFDSDGHRIADSGEPIITDRATTVVFDVARADLGLKGPRAQGGNPAPGGCSSEPW